MSVKKILRKKAMNYLPQATYVFFAQQYNNLISNLKEYNLRKPCDFIVDCNVPLIYISQPARQGGTLIRNLFDGHPKLFVFPHELSFQKNGYHWEQIQHNKKSFELLRDRWVTHAIVNGLDKHIPFYFNRRIQKKIFFSNKKDKTRDVLGAYFTSFFNAWINYQNLYSIGKKFIVAFCPWNLNEIKDIEAFFSVYQDGYRLQIIRNPLAWWASEKNYGNETKKVNDYLEQRWINSVRTGIKANEIFPDHYLLINYDELVKSPEKSLIQICNKINIDFNKIMLRPTINDFPRISNTSFGKGAAWIDSSRLNKWKEKLDRDEINFIKKETNDLYDDALHKCLNVTVE